VHECTRADKVLFIHRPKWCLAEVEIKIVIDSWSVPES